MPKAGMYRANSVIYFQGDLSDKIDQVQAKCLNESGFAHTRYAADAQAERLAGVG